MEKVVLVIHLMVTVALIGVILMQKSEGGALGIGGGGMSNFMTGRGTANVLTRATAILAASFFVTSLTLVLIPQFSGKAPSILPVSQPTQQQLPIAPAPTPLAPTTPTGPSVPVGQ
jgi:preprotein translocase subunit SecG